MSGQEGRELMVRFGENLTRARRLADMTQDSVALGAGLHRTEVSPLERGLRLPRLDTIVKLSGTLEVEPAELLEGMKWVAGSVRQGRFGADAGEGVER
jgi:transcriptional regulator with XRE-family HTH domain